MTAYVQIFNFFYLLGNRHIDLMNVSFPFVKSSSNIDTGDFTNYYNMLCENNTLKLQDLIEENISKGSMEYIYRILSLDDDFDPEEKEKRTAQLGKYFTWKGRKWATQKKK
jgi:hypothetical protein